MGGIEILSVSQERNKFSVQPQTNDGSHNHRAEICTGKNLLLFTMFDCLSEAQLDGARCQIRVGGQIEELTEYSIWH